MLPITGPVIRVTSNGNYWLRTESWRQKAPYGLVLPYSYDRKQILTASGISATPEGWLSIGPSSGVISRSISGARDRFVDKVRGSSSELGATLGESRQALEMLATRGLQLARFYKHLRRLELGDAAKALGLRHIKPRNLRHAVKGVKDFSGAVLETAFGWSPLVQDIGNAIDVLQRELPKLYVRAACTDTYTASDVPAEYETRFIQAKIRGSTGAQVWVDNPNLYLANRLGLINPAAIVWELVPFSFIVDYFINVGKFLSSFTEFYGVSITAPWYAFRYDMQLVHSKSNPISGQKWSVTGLRTQKGRSLGLPTGPELQLEEFRLPPGRAITSISLVMQALTGKLLENRVFGR